MPSTAEYRLATVTACLYWGWARGRHNPVEKPEMPSRSPWKLATGILIPPRCTTMSGMWVRLCAKALYPELTSSLPLNYGIPTRVISQRTTHSTAAWNNSGLSTSTCTSFTGQSKICATTPGMPLKKSRNPDEPAQSASVIFPINIYRNCFHIQIHDPWSIRSNSAPSYSNHRSPHSVDRRAYSLRVTVLWPKDGV